MRVLGSAVVLLAGAGAYAGLVGSGALRFSATPLLLGILAVAAGSLGTRRRVTATGLVLVGWGTAVLLVDAGRLPGARTAPAYMLGVGAGLLAAAAVAPRRDRGDWLVSASVTAVMAPLSLYLSYDLAALGRWPVWSVLLLVWAAWEGVLAWRSVRPEPAAEDRRAPV